MDNYLQLLHKLQNDANISSSMTQTSMDAPAPSAKRFKKLSPDGSVDVNATPTLYLQFLIFVCVCACNREGTLHSSSRVDDRQEGSRPLTRRALTLASQA